MDDIQLGTLVTMLCGGALLPRRANTVVVRGLATAMSIVVFFITALGQLFSGWTGIPLYTMQRTLANMSAYGASAPSSREQLLREIVMCAVPFGGG